MQNKSVFCFQLSLFGINQYYKNNFLFHSNYFIRGVNNAGIDFKFLFVTSCKMILYDEIVSVPSRFLVLSEAITRCENYENKFLQNEMDTLLVSWHKFMFSRSSCDEQRIC